MFILIGLGIFVPLLAVYCFNKITCGICKTSRHLVGKVVIVTVGNAGIGYETAKNLAERGAKVILACRNDPRGTAARDKIIRESGNQDVHFKKLDLASFASVRAFAEDINKNEKRIDILINNAGIIMERKKELTEDGLLIGMQANHFGPFLLTNLLLDKIKASAPSRIINVSSNGYMTGKIEFDNLNMEKEAPDTISPFQVYTNSKLCNILMTVELSRQLKGTGVTTNALCPGTVTTEIIKNIDWLLYKLLFKMPLSKMVILKTPWEGAQTTIHLAVSPELENVSGEYFRDCALTKRIARARDADVAKKLWEVSKKICKLRE